MKVEELLTYWYECLLNWKEVKVFEWRGDIYWTDRFGFARVPELLQDEVEPGSLHSVSPTGVEVIAPFNIGNTYEVLESLESKCRLIVVDSEIDSQMEIQQASGKKGQVEVREYKTKTRGEVVPVRAQLHRILESTIRRGALLYTNSDREYLSSKIDGSLVASVAAIKINP